MRRWLDVLQASSAGRWWRGKPANDQLVYSALAGAAALTLLWLGLWRPLADWQAEQALRLESAEQLAGWLAANEDRARAAAVTLGQGGGNGAILPLLTQAADAAGIRLSRLQPEDSGSVSVILEQQPFNTVVALLAQLEERQGIAVQRASIDAHHNAGLVNVQLRLRRVGAGRGP